MNETRNVSFHMVPVVTYCYEGEHGYFRSWHDRHGWGDVTLARAVKLTPTDDGQTIVTVVGDAGQRSHREVKRTWGE